MDETSNTCRHTDVQTFDSFRCCLSCGELVTELASPSISDPPFEYKPLDCESEQHIRLVHVHPGLKREDIVCELVHVSLAAARIPVYEAVSYTWATADGDASLSRFIVCHGKKLAITKNCEAAIRCLRRRDRSRVLWIDAICIDQESTTERNHQVGLMADIYSKASQVLVYLGFRDPTTISGFLIYLDKRSRGIITGDPRIEKSWFREFLQHPYFNRVWVLQEISLARLVVVHTDDQIIYWDARTVQELIFHCKRLNHDPPGALHWLPATQRDEHNCLDLLHRARRCMATDPRDKIFALYGFLPLHFREALPVNYAIGTEEVYSNIATYLISTTKQLDVLKHVPPYQPLDLDAMPSWVPDWSVRHFLDMELPKFTVLQKAKFALFRSNSISMDTLVDSTMRLTTAHVPQHDHHKEPSAQHDESILWYRQPSAHRHSSIHIEIDAKRFSKIPCLRVRGYLLDKIATHTYDIPQLEDGRFLQLLRADPEGTPFLNSAMCPSCIEVFEWTTYDGASSDEHRTYQSQQLADLRQIMINLRGEKQAFLTQQSIGFVLFTPIHGSSLPNHVKRVQPLRIRRVQPGDTIWALEGLDVPVVLRRGIKDGQSHYILIGQCYLHRAGLDQECPGCGTNTEPWSMKYTTIDIW